jgi:hypothetical protein
MRMDAKNIRKEESMNKGLKTTLFAMVAAVAGISSSYASAPVISSLPDIVVGDQENNYAGTDNNYFVFTNAYLFDSYVTDTDSTVSTLLWSFDEESAPVGPANRWYTVNGKNSIYNTNAGAAGDPAGTAHVLPLVANELRAASPYASFRDVIYSPGSGPLVASFPDSNQVNSHAAGRLLTFWVSDTQNVTSDTALVKSLDDGNDFKSDVLSVLIHNDNQFTSSLGWIPTNGNSTFQSTSFVTSNNGELRGTILSIAPSANTIRTIGWIESPHAPGDANSLHLTLGEAGTSFVRAKFYLYSLGSVAANGNNPPNTIPNLRLRVTTRYAYNMMADLFHHSTQIQADAKAHADDYTPSTNPAAPSVYRVDLDPPQDLPYVVANPDETLQRGFEAFAPGYEPDSNGTIAMTESSIGTYPALDLSTPAYLTKTYTGSDLDGTATGQNVRFSEIPHGPAVAVTKVTTNGSATFGGGVGPGFTSSFASGAFTLSTQGVSDNILAVAEADFNLASVSGGDADHRNRVRMETGKQYVISFRATSTVNPTNQSWLRFRARSVAFAWNYRLETSGAWQWDDNADGIRSAADIADKRHIIAQQFQPTTTPKWYHVFMNTALDPDIRADVAGSIATKFPDLAAQPGPGQGAATVSPVSRRDIYVGLDVIDSISSQYYVASYNDPGEKGHVTIDRIEVRTFNKIPD